MNPKYISVAFWILIGLSVYALSFTLLWHAVMPGSYGWLSPAELVEVRNGLAAVSLIGAVVLLAGAFARL